MTTYNFTLLDSTYAFYTFKSMEPTFCHVTGIPSHVTAVLMLTILCHYINSLYLGDENYDFTFCFI